MKRFRALLLAVVATLCCSFFTLTEVRHSSPQPALRICTAVVYSCMRQCVLLFHLLTLICVMYPMYRYIQMYSCIMLQLHCGTRPFVPIILGVIVLSSSSTKFSTTVSAPYPRYPSGYMSTLLSVDMLTSCCQGYS